eukprot:COSAG06_NODE_19650_length_828_cov_1.272977_2_plen_115_part_01
MVSVTPPFLSSMQIICEQNSICAGANFSLYSMSSIKPPAGGAAAAVGQFDAGVSMLARRTEPSRPSGVSNNDPGIAAVVTDGAHAAWGAGATTAAAGRAARPLLAVRPRGTRRQR